MQGAARRGAARSINRWPAQQRMRCAVIAARQLQPRHARYVLRSKEALAARTSAAPVRHHDRLSPSIALFCERLSVFTPPPPRYRRFFFAIYASWRLRAMPLLTPRLRHLRHAAKIALTPFFAMMLIRHSPFIDAAACPLLSACAQRRQSAQRAAPCIVTVCAATVRR